MLTTLSGAGALKSAGSLVICNDRLLSPCDADTLAQGVGQSCVGIPGDLGEPAECACTGTCDCTGDDDEVPACTP